MIFLKLLILILVFILVRASVTRPKVTSITKNSNVTRVVNDSQSNLKEECEILLQNRLYYGPFKPIMTFILYELLECDVHWIAVDAIFYGIILVPILIVLFGVLLFLRCRKEPKRKTNLNNISDDNEDHTSPQTMEQNSVNLEQNESNLLSTIEQEQANKEVDQKLQQKRLEMMEFYRRLLLYQMFKRHKQEETLVEKTGNLLRRGIDILFGEPYRGLDLTNPQALFYPYWPERTDHNLLNAYEAIREYMMTNQNLSASSSKPQNDVLSKQNANSFVYTPTKNDLTYQEAYLKNIFGKRNYSKTERNIKFNK
jgi:flagellar basal body-associated protein FliL